MVKKLFILHLLFFVFINNAKSTHIVSADLTYECLGGLNYKFTMKLYRDCAGQAIGTFQQVKYSSASTSPGGVFLLFLDTSYEVSQVCDSLLPYTTCQPSGTLPGIQVYEYSALLTLPNYASDWNFENEICCRSTSITNLMSGFPFYTNTTLDNLDGKCNNSPTFQAIPLLYSCSNETVNFNNIAIDTEGDSLSFKLVGTWGGNGVSIPYTNTSYNANNPFGTISGIVFDTITGQITFNSNSMQQAILTVLITEYDASGNVKGTHRRDIQFIFINCPPPPFNPYTSGVNYDTANYTYVGCYNTPISFDVFSVSFDSINPIELHYFSNIPNATFTTRVSADTTYGTFSWIPGTRLGKYYFRLQTIAKTCPLKRQNIFNYTVQIDTVFSACKDTSLFLSTLGYFAIDSTYVLDFNSSGNCPIKSVTLSKDTFDCTDLGTTPISVTTVYENGLVRTCTSNITLIDTISPVSGCVDTTVYLNSSGYVIIDSSFIHDYTIISCGTSTIKLDRYVFTCSEVGANTVGLEVTEVNGLKDTCYGIVTVVDTFMPKAVCIDTVIYLDANGLATADSSFLDNGSSDNCAIVKRYLSQSNFDCTHVGVNNVTLYVEDYYGNLDSCQAIITVRDTNAITVKCKDTTVYLTGGVINLTPAHLDGGSSAVCGLSNATLDKYTFTCADTGANSVKLIISNSQGDKDSCVSIVTVIDSSKVTFTCKDTLVYLNAMGIAVIDSSFVLDNLQNNTCNLLGVVTSTDTFDCSNVGSNFVTTNAVYKYGTSQISRTSIVTVLDTLSPTAICKNISVYLNANGVAVIDSSFINDGSNDNCSISTITLSKTSFDCGNIGSNSVTMTVTDINGNVSTCSAKVSVFDTINPTVICKDITVYLNTAGVVVLDSSSIDNGSYDSCGIAEISLKNKSFDCSNLGSNSVWMIVQDVNGNSDSCSAIVTVLDTLSPVAICKNISVYLNASGNVEIDSSDVNNGSSDNCEIATITLNKSSFNCSNLGANVITMTVTDINGNSSICSSTVTIIDSVKPTVSCMDTTIFLNSLGTVTIDSSYLNNGSNDNCSVATVSISKNTFDCSVLGANWVTLVVTDGSGNVDSCISVVTVLDTVKPVLNCADTTVYLNSLGTVTIDSSYLSGGSTDNCGIATIGVSNETFNCSQIGSNYVAIGITDVNGNTDSCMAIVTVLDTISPLANCKNISVYLDASGNVQIDSSDINNGSTDNCGIATIKLNKTSFSCSQNGVNNVTMVVTDVNGNIDSCVSLVTVIDTLKPTAVCKDTSIYLNGSGFFTIDTTFIENGSFDNCSIDSIRLSKYTFDCTDVGNDTIQLYVFDKSGNVDSCTAYVTILDTTNPITTCKDTTVYLNSAGIVTINSNHINGSQGFGCPINSMTLSKYTFDCNDLGANFVGLKVTDNNGNSDSCTSTVTVLDTLKPTVTCSNISVYLNAAGNATIDSSMLDNGSTDNCGINTMSLSRTTFDCNAIGAHFVTMTVTDINGNSDSCIATVTVLDTLNPIVICKDTTVYLSASGVVTIDSSFTNNGISDNCSVSSMSLSKYSFNCGDIGSNSVTTVVTDANGNSDSCVAFITVLDTVNPFVQCRNNTVYLNSTGTAVIDSSFVDNGSNDSCGISSITLSQSNFDCSNVGTNFVTMIVTDINGNSDSCVSTITVLDTTNPVANCKNISVYLDASGNTQIDSSSIDNNSADNCGISTIKLSEYNFNCSQIGTNFVTMTIMDINGNVDSCTAIVTVVDSIKPVVVCMDTTIYLNAMGSAAIDSSFINNGSTDNCGVSSVSLSKSQFNCSNIGANVITMLVTDVNGNKDSCLATVTVIDTIIPTAYAGADTSICGQFTIQMNARQLQTNQIGAWSIITPSPSVPNVSNVNNPISTVSNLSIGSYEFVWSVTNGNGCHVVYDTVEVNILDTLFANAGPDELMCGQFNTSFFATPAAYGISGTWSTLSYSTTMPTIANPQFANSPVSNLADGSYEFVWTISNGLCADAHDTILIEVYDEPVSNAGLDQNLCATYNTTLAANMPAGRSKGEWSIISSSNSSSPVFLDSSVYNTSVSGLQEGTYRLLWTVTNGNCDPELDTIIINVYDMPIANAGMDAILCEIDSLRLLATPPAGSANGSWTYGASGNPSITGTNITDSTFCNTMIYNLPVGGSQSLIWTVSNGTCPEQKDTMKITVQAKPIVNAGEDTSYCTNYSITLNALPLVAPAKGFWSLDSSSAPNLPMFTNKNNPATTVTGLIEGTYKFIWRGQNLPCFDISDTVIVSVSDKHKAQVGADQLLCNQSKTLITGNSVTGTATSKWILNSYNANIPTFDSTLNSTSLGGLVQGGTYSMVWEIKNGVCPISRDTVVVTNQFAPESTFAQDVDEICQGESVTMFSTGNIPLPHSISNHKWTINGLTHSGTFVTKQFNTPGYHGVNLIVSASNGCLDTIQKDSAVFVHANPIADFSIDYAPNTLEVKINDLSQSACCYLYDFGNGDNSIQPEPIYTFSDTGVQTIRQFAANTFGCLDSVTKTVYVQYLTVYVPNAFTPNEDGKNDVFMPVLAGHNTDIYEFNVFNRWGELIYKSNSSEDGWNGKHRGQDVPGGVYVWTLKTGSKVGKVINAQKGQVTLIR